jgi:hypothetical protein
MADIVVLGTTEEIHTGSSPVKGTNALVVKLDRHAGFKPQ